MNADLLHHLCKTYRKETAESFQHYILNALWPLTKNIIETEIAQMKQDFGMKVYKKMFDAENLTQPQIDFVKTTIDSYVVPMVNRARTYAFSLVTN